VKRALLFVAACNAQNGTISLSMVTAPGATVLDAAQSLTVTITNPVQTITAQRGSDGFDLDFQIDPSGASGAIAIDAFDANDARIATGRSPAFPISAIDATVKVYMAAPRTIGAAPTALPDALSQLGVARLNYGAAFVGGKTVAGAPSGDLTIYNAYDHSVTAAVPLAMPVFGPAVAAGASGLLFIFGGTDATGAPTGTVNRFDATVAPSGQYTFLSNHPELARTGQTMVRTNADELLVTGAPVAQLTQLGSTIAALPAPASLPVGDASYAGGVYTAVFADGTRFRDDAIDRVTAPAHAYAVTALGDGFAIAGDTLALGDGTTGAPTTARTNAAVAGSDRYLLIAGGDGAAMATADLYDAQLAPVATLPLVVPRTGASAVPLPNGQILIVGGVDASNAPIATIELFTPD